MSGWKHTGSVFHRHEIANGFDASQRNQEDEIRMNTFHACSRVPVGNKNIP